MKKYELMYILVSATSDEAKDETIAKVNALIERNGGVIEQIEKIGNKKLAYEINHVKEGFYCLVNFSIESIKVKDITSVLAITEDVLRFIVVAK